LEGKKQGTERAMIASAGDWGAVALLLLVIFTIWGLYAFWIVRHRVRPVEVAFHYDKPPEVALREWAGFYTEWLAASGYVMVAQELATLTYWRRYFPSWVVAVAVLFFPIGLLALLAGRRDATLLVSAAPEPGSTRIDVRGSAHRPIARELEADAATARAPVPA
jgi:hypothetical protein